MKVFPCARVCVGAWGGGVKERELVILYNW